MADDPEFAIAGYDFRKSNGGGPYDTDVGKFSMARQEFKEECDINTIMERYQATGFMPPAVGEPVYVDFSEMPDDLMGLMARLDEAQAAFMTLPARVRAEFENNAHAFVQFASDPVNIGQMREWGLAPPEPPVAAAPAEPASAGEPAQSST